MGRKKKFSDSQLLDQLEAGSYPSKIAIKLSSDLGLKVSEAAILARINKLHSVGRIERVQNYPAKYKVNRNWVEKQSSVSLIASPKKVSFESKLFGLHRCGAGFDVVEGRAREITFLGVRPEAQRSSKSVTFRWKHGDWTLEAYPRVVKVWVKRAEKNGVQEQYVWALQRIRELIEQFVVAQGFNVNVPDGFKQWRRYGSPEWVSFGMGSEWSLGLIDDFGLERGKFKPLNDSVEAGVDSSHPKMVEFRDRLGAREGSTTLALQVWHKMIEQNSPEVLNRHEVVLQELTVSFKRIIEFMSENRGSSVAPEKQLPKVEDKDRRECA